MNSPGMISEASKHDYADLVDLWEASVRATHHFLTNSDIAYFRPLILNEFLDAVELRVFRTDDHKIAAFIGVANGNIEMLFVAPQHFGKGLGKALLLYAIQKMDADRVDVNEQNPRAVDFYQHNGFEVVGRSEQDSMGKPFPLLHMALSDSRSVQ